MIRGSLRVTEAAVTCFSPFTECGHILLLQCQASISMWSILLAFHNYPCHVVSLRVKVQWKLSMFIGGTLFRELDWGCLIQRVKPPCKMPLSPQFCLTSIRSPPNSSQTFQLSESPSSAIFFKLKDKFGPGSIPWEFYLSCVGVKKITLCLYLSVGWGRGKMGDGVRVFAFIHRSLLQ